MQAQISKIPATNDGTSASLIGKIEPLLLTEGNKVSGNPSYTQDFSTFYIYKVGTEMHMRGTCSAESVHHMH